MGIGDCTLLVFCTWDEVSLVTLTKAGVCVRRNLKFQRQISTLLPNFWAVFCKENTILRSILSECYSWSSWLLVGKCFFYYSWEITTAAPMHHLLALAGVILRLCILPAPGRQVLTHPNSWDFVHKWVKRSHAKPFFIKESYEVMQTNKLNVTLAMGSLATNCTLICR